MFVARLKRGAQTNWAVYSVMAHEIGHHLQGHTLRPGGSRPSIELEADEYSGFILAKLGASLDDAQKAMRTFGSDASSGTHPATNSRLAAIENGWERGTQRKPTAPDRRPDPAPQPAPQPRVTYTDSCIVNGAAVVITADGAILSKMRGYVQVGRKVSPANPNCVFDLVSPAGRFCVAGNGAVFFGTPFPVGQCQPCAGNLCP